VSKRRQPKLQEAPERRQFNPAVLALVPNYCHRCHLRLDVVLNRIQIFNGSICLGCAEYIIAEWIGRHPAGL